MAAPRKRSSKKMSHAHLQDLAVLCGGLVLLIAIATLFSSQAMMPAQPVTADTH